MPSQLRITGVSIAYGVGAMHAMQIRSIPKNVSPTERLLFLVLASHANNRDGTCFPSQKLLAEETGLGISSIQRNLRALQDAGLIIIQNRTVENSKGNRQKLTNVYKIVGIQKFIGPRIQDRHTDRSWSDSVEFEGV